MNETYFDLHGLDLFLQPAEPPQDMELDQAMEAYQKRFGCPVPLEMIPIQTDRAVLLGAVKTCLEEGNDNIFQYLGLELPPDALF